MLRPKKAPQKQPPRRRARSKSNTSAARRKKAPPSATGACTGNARGYPMRGRAWGTRGVENITSSNENLNAALQGGMPRDGLHNPRESVVVGVGMATRRLFTTNSSAIGKKSNAVDRPRPRYHRPHGVVQAIPSSNWSSSKFWCRCEIQT